MEFIESSIFTRLVRHYLDELEYASLQWHLVQHPDAGDIIPGSGGLRKIRWPGSGKGKRGGLRVIYYWRNQAGEIWLLTIYAKSEAVNIPMAVLRAIREELET
ncbi:MAG: transcriptional regulator [Deltaproteobacteria bacterium]|nr:transcriptional regulator [Deltaproteobacteria bacterium]